MERAAIARYLRLSGGATNSAITFIEVVDRALGGEQSATTALIETGSKMDDVIFEEFKGTGNMELRLDRRLAERRIYPSIDVEASSTRHEELLFDRIALQQVWKLRRVLNALEGGAGLELLIDKIRTTKSNDQFLSDIAKAPVGTPVFFLSVAVRSLSLLRAASLRY